MHMHTIACVFRRNDHDRVRMFRTSCDKLVSEAARRQFRRTAAFGPVPRATGVSALEGLRCLRPGHHVAGHDLLLLCVRRAWAHLAVAIARSMCRQCVWWTAQLGRGARRVFACAREALGRVSACDVISFASLAYSAGRSVWPHAAFAASRQGVDQRSIARSRWPGFAVWMAARRALSCADGSAPPPRGACARPRCRAGVVICLVAASMPSHVPTVGCPSTASV